jgi:hypothetical protein
MQGQIAQRRLVQRWRHPPFLAALAARAPSRFIVHATFLPLSGRNLNAPAWQGER